MDTTDIDATNHVADAAETAGPSLTGELADARPNDAQVLNLQLTHFGAVHSFGGHIETVDVHDDNAIVRQVLERPGDGRVLVVDGHGTTECAISGPTHVEIALRNRWAGIIVNGPVRYVRWLAQQPFGIMARGAHPRQPGKTGAGTVGRLVRFGGVTFIPGAYLRADEDGVVVVPWP